MHSRVTASEKVNTGNNSIKFIHGCMLTCVLEYSQLGMCRFSTTKGLRITKMERNLFSVSPADWATVLCFKYITLVSKKSRNIQKEALLERDGKVNN